MVAMDVRRDIQGLVYVVGIVIHSSQCVNEALGLLFADKSVCFFGLPRIYIPRAFFF